jgi:hypothetical protein
MMLRQLYSRDDVLQSRPSRDDADQSGPSWSLSTTLYELPDGSLWVGLIVSRSAFEPPPNAEAGNFGGFRVRPVGFLFQPLTPAPRAP